MDDQGHAVAPFLASKGNGVPAESDLITAKKPIGLPMIPFARGARLVLSDGRPGQPNGLWACDRLANSAHSATFRKPAGL
jgi:hypothetical protein